MMSCWAEELHQQPQQRELPRGGEMEDFIVDVIDWNVVGGACREEEEYHEGLADDVCSIVIRNQTILSSSASATLRFVS
jgi:hypothetical protein